MDLLPRAYPAAHRTEGRATDIDELLTRRRPTWERLDELVRRGRRRPQQLSPAELDELVDAHLSTSVDLSLVRSRAPDPALQSELTGLVARSSAVLYGTSSRSRSGLADLLLVQVPAALWAIRLQVVLAAVALVLPAVLAGVFVATDDRVVPLLGEQTDLEQFVEQDFVDYYTENPNPVFAAAVGTNNIRVGLLAFGAGALFGLPTLLLLAFNGLNIGVAGGIIHAFDQPAVFWTSILPHGLLELSAIVVSGAAGMRLGWSLLVPGDRTRGEALAEEGQRAGLAMLGMVAAFAVAALLEGFVTPRSWSPWVEIPIGAAALLAFVLPVLSLGPAADAEVRARRPVAGGARVVGADSTSVAVWRRDADVGSGGGQG